MIALLAALEFGAGAAGEGALAGGWWQPEAAFVWSQGGRSSLRLPAPPRPQGVRLELTLEPFVSLPALRRQACRVTVNGETVAERLLGGEERWGIDVPAGCLRGQPELRIDLDLPDAMPPSAFVPGADGRRLGVKLRRLVMLQDPERIDPAARSGRLAIANELRFGWSETSQNSLLDGWGAPEAGYVWALGRHSTLRIGLGAPRPGRRLLIDMLPCLLPPELTCQRVAIGAAGRLLEYVSMMDRTVVALALPAEAAGEASVDISFENLDAGDARAVGLDSEGRPFAFALLGVTVLDEAQPLPEVPTARLAPVHGALADNSLQKTVHLLAGLPAADLASRFQSLGNGCEFGLLQRRLGEETAGLLRFAGIPTPHLVNGLLHGFAGLGRPDSFVINTRADFNCGYWVVDDAYHLALQTPVSSHEVPEHQLLRQLARNLPFLRRKLFEDIAAADKIYIFQRRDAVARVEAEAVLAALAVWGDPTMLWVTYEPHEQPGGAVRLGPRLIKGFLDRMSKPGDATPDDILLSILANAWRLARLN